MCVPAGMTYHKPVLIDIYGRRWVPKWMDLDGFRRKITAWPDWAISTRIRDDACVPAVRDAILCHQSQVNFMFTRSLSDAEWTALCRQDCFYRVFTTVDGASSAESDLFAGLRRSDRSQPI